MVSPDLDIPSSQHAERLTATTALMYESPGAPSRALGFPERSTVGSRSWCSKGLRAMSAASRAPR